MTDTGKTGTNQDNGAPDLQAGDLLDIIARDKKRGLEVVQAAGREISEFTNYQIVPDITGNPRAAREHANYKQEQYRGLRGVKDNPFYARVDTVCSLNGRNVPLQLLLTKSRHVGVLDADDWMVVPWTAPVANRIRGHQPGTKVEVAVGRGTTEYRVGESCTYGALFPDAQNIEMLLKAGTRVILHEAELRGAAAAEVFTREEVPPQEYAAKEQFGLGEIIVLADKPQQAAMALPFGHSVIIEGPPGSGKTSVGLMRTAVLYDQQWDALGLKQGTDQPFHRYSSMRVLVFNVEMVEYLRTLMNSIGAERVSVTTTADFLRRVCRETRMLSGTSRRDRPSLAAVKCRIDTLHAFFAGFKAHLADYWSKARDPLRSKLFVLGPDFLVLADRLNDWVERVQRATVTGDHISGGIGIVDGLTDARIDIERLRSPTRHKRSAAVGAEVAGPSPEPLRAEDLQKRMKAARELIEKTLQAACDRAPITRAMFELPAYVELKEAAHRAGIDPRTMDSADRLWKKQYKGGLPAYSELDLTMCAWLGARLLLTKRSNPKPWIGGQLEQLTHIVVDEAQDLSPSHLAVLKSQLVAQGTMTLVGDLHQGLHPQTGLKRWEDAGLIEPRRSVFGVNHRQTHQLGEFMQSLHTGLFDEECPWGISPRTTGAKPRAGTARSWLAMVNAIAAEVRHWRSTISGSTGATVAVLHDGKLEPKRRKWLRQKLEVLLADQLIVVELADPKSGGDQLRRTDRVLIATVRQTKGLEFDAVIFIETKAKWSKPVDQIDVRIRNGFYVATSRAKAGLSMCMSNLPSCVVPLFEKGLCDKVEWTDAGES